MDIQNTSYKEIAKIIYPHCLQGQINRRNKYIAIFNTNDFKGMNDCHPYIKKVQKEYTLEASSLSEVIKELQSFKLPLHCSEPYIEAECQCDYEERFLDDNPQIKLNYYEYSISSEKLCESIAKHIAEGHAWKLKHQPNGKDGKAALKLLQQYI